MMKKCPNCLEDIEENFSVCPFCGAVFRSGRSVIDRVNVMLRLVMMGMVTGLLGGCCLLAGSFQLPGCATNTGEALLMAQVVLGLGAIAILAGIVQMFIK